MVQKSSKATARSIIRRNLHLISSLCPAPGEEKTGKQSEGAVRRGRDKWQMSGLLLSKTFACKKKKKLIQCHFFS
jgi:hypothetical protein